jgi:hypothetical protein
MFLQPYITEKTASGYQDSDHSPRIRQRFSLQQAGSTGPSPNTRQGQHPRYLQEEETQVEGHRAGCLVRTRRRRVGKLLLPSILLANVQSLDNKLDEVRSRISYQRDIKNCNILCFTELWLNDGMDIQLAGYMLHRQDRTAQ